ncbi:MAG: SDR family NAD(P)-dependent oxidoreductase, partial [Myxococcota bacterium]
MAGRRFVLTGATAGIGQAAAEAFAAAGADLLLVARSRERAERTAERLREKRPGCNVDIVLADLASQAQIRRVAEEILAACPRIDVLFNNAGLVNLRRRETEDGIESTFAVNHLAYFLLTNLLVPRLRETPGARIVLTASDAHRMAGPLDFDDLGFERGFSGMRAYGRSKGANILYTRELARRLAGSGVTVNCFHPGMVRSELGGNEGVLARVVQKLIWPFALPAARGADTGV